MFYALVHNPAVDAVSIKQLRKKYDPQVELIEPHITIVFPVPESIGEQSLISHIQNVLLAWRPFNIHQNGLQLSWDNYLFLLVQEGKSDVIAYTMICMLGVGQIPSGQGAFRTTHDAWFVF